MSAPTVRLLTRLFVRRLLDNDVISPHADRHDSLGVLYAVIVSLAVFVTFFVSTPYLAAYIQLPGQTALSALPDRFLFIAASLAVSALAALLVWDALGLEPRDAAILGPLPIAPWAITRAEAAGSPRLRRSVLGRHQCRAHHPLSDVHDREPARSHHGRIVPDRRPGCQRDHGGPLASSRFSRRVACCALPWGTGVRPSLEQGFKASSSSPRSRASC
jgi:hypothetical protein